MAQIIQYPNQRYVARCPECQGTNWELIVDGVEINKIEGFYCVGCELTVDLVLDMTNQETFEAVLNEKPSALKGEARAALNTEAEELSPPHACPRCDAPNPDHADMDGCRDPNCPEDGQ